MSRVHSRDRCDDCRQDRSPTTLAALVKRRDGFIARFLARWHARSELLKTALGEYERDYARYFATAMVYYVLVSLVPLVLLLLAVLGLLLRLSDLASLAAERILDTVEGSFGAPLRSTIEEGLRRLEQGSIVGTLIAVAGLLLTASVLFAHLRITFRAIWKQASPLASGSVRGAAFEILLEKSIAFLMVLAGGPLLLGMLVLIAVLHWVSGLFSNVPLLGGAIGWLLALSSPLLFVPIVFLLLFKFLPPVRVQWRDVWFPVALCSLAWIVGAEVLVLYAIHFGDNFSTYGALGGILILMLWIKMISQMLFVGAELCKVASQAGASKASVI